jgi:CheY-like chemotaxis protein
LEEEEVDEMEKKIVLLVEDSTEEQEKAKRILAEEGLRPVVAATLFDARRLLEKLKGKTSGIITDLHFSEFGSDRSEDSPEAPRGLAIIVEGIEQKIPVVVCSEINHHFAGYLTKVIEKLATLSSFGEIPFITNFKDWQRAARELKKLIIGGEK